MTGSHRRGYRRVERLILLFLAALPILWYATPLFTDQTYFETDLSGQYAPWWDYARDRFAQGEFPLWNPHVFGGTPYHVNPENALYYPFRLLLALVGFWTAAPWIRVLDSAAAAIGMYLFLRHLRVGLPGSITGALAFTYGSFFSYEFVHMPYIHTTAWLPWQLLALRSLTRGPGLRTAGLLAFFTALSFLGGSPGVFIICQLAAAVFLIFECSMASHAPLARIVPALLGAMLLFTALTAVLWLPALNFAALTPRDEPGTYLVDVLRSGLSFDVVRTFLFPMHDLALGIPYPPAYTNQFLYAPYVGMAGIFLALAAFQNRRLRRRVWPFALMLLFGVLMAMGHHSGLFPLLFRTLVFVQWFRWPHDYAFLAYLSLSILAAIGIDAFRRPQRRMLTALLTMLTLYSLAAFAALPTATTARGIAALVLPGLALLPWLLRRTRSGAIASTLLWLILFSADLFIYGLGFRHYMPAAALDLAHIQKLIAVPQKIDPLARIAVSTLKPSYCRGEEQYLYSFLPITHEPIKEEWDFTSNRHWLRKVPIGPLDEVLWNRHRLFTFSNWKHPSWTYPINMAMSLGYQEPGGYDPFIQKRVTELFKTLRIEQTWRLMNVRFVITPNQVQIPGFKTIQADDTGYVYMDDFAIPRCYLASEIHSGLEPEKVLTTLQRDVPITPHHPLPYSKALLETTLEPGAAEPATPEQGDAAAVTRYLHERVEIAVKAIGPRLLVLNDVYCPGWVAELDGKPLEIIRANYLLRAVAIPAGDHRIVFRYRPLDLYAAGGVSAIAWLLLPPLLLCGRRRRRPTQLSPASRFAGQTLFGAGAIVLTALTLLSDSEVRPVHELAGWPHRVSHLDIAAYAAEQEKAHTVDSSSVTLYQDTSLGYAINLPPNTAGEFWFIARGVPANGIHSAVDIELDGAPLDRVYCAAEGWLLHRIPFNARPGRHVVRLSFVNDEFRYPEDRNLELMELGFGPPPKAAVEAYCRKSGETWEAADFSRAIMSETEEGIARLWPGGVIADDIALDAGPHSLSLWVRPASTGPAPSELVIMLDNTSVATCRIGGPDWTLIQAPFESSAGRHRLSLLHRSTGARRSHGDLMLATVGINVVTPRPVESSILLPPDGQVQLDLHRLRRPAASQLTNDTLTLWANGILAFDFESAIEQTVHLGFLARGELCRGIWPSLRLSLDDHQLATFNLQAPIPTPFGKTFPVKKGRHRITLEFRNDERDAAGDRNVHIYNMGFILGDALPIDSLGPPSVVLPAMAGSGP